MSARSQNEKIFRLWDFWGEGGRRYWLNLPGRSGWVTRYLKEVDIKETTLHFWREIYDNKGKLARTHEIFPVEKAHLKVYGSAVTVTKKDVAAKMAEYFNREITLAELVEWSGLAMKADLAESDFIELAEVLSHLGAMDVREFGLSWEDCKELLGKLGFACLVELVPM